MRVLASWQKRQTPPLRWARPLVGAALTLATFGCQCGRDRPYTPFHIEPSASALSSSAAPTVPSDFEPHPAAIAPPDVSEWTINGVVLVVDKSRVIERAVAADFDGDGKNEAVAWTHNRAESPDSEVTGELVLFSSKAPAGRMIGKIPGFVPAGLGCHHSLALTQTGSRTVTLDVAAKCDAQLVPRSPTRGITVLAPAADRPTVLVLRLADPAPSELTTFTVESRDRDGDGRDDVRLVATLKTNPDEPVASADFIWLDRAAGPAREADEPRKSLANLVSAETQRADGKNANRWAPIRVANARRLVTTLCAESGAARLFDADGVALPCGDLGPTMAELTSAEVRAAILRHDALSATAALGHDAWYFAPLTEKARAFLEKEILGFAPSRAANETGVAAPPKAKAGLPRWSPLWFESPSALLVQTADGVVRATLPGLQVTDASEGVDAWPVGIGGGADPRWTGVAFPCDRSEVLLLLSSPEGTPLPSAPTSVLAPRPGPCGKGLVPTPEIVPIEWNATRKVGLIGGALFGADGVAGLGAQVTKGSPRSPDGKSLVVPWAKGLLVVNGSKAETWTVNDPMALSDCVVATGAAVAACIRGDHAIVITPEPGTKAIRK